MSRMMQRDSRKHPAGYSQELSENPGEGAHFQGESESRGIVYSFRLWGERRGGIGQIREVASCLVKSKDHGGEPQYPFDSRNMEAK